MILCFRDLYPDELLYSGWARFSDRVKYSHKANVLRDLFGSRNIKPIIDFPCHIKYFVDILPLETLYTVDYLIDYHTLLPFYSPFLPQERLNRIREQMAVGEVKALHRHVGIGTGVLLSSIWLRYCPACVEDEREKLGECYWHRLHQVTGVEICPVHNVFLENSIVRTRSGNLSELGIFSAEHAIRAVPPRVATSSPFFNVLMAVATNADYLLQHPTSTLDAHFLRQQYRALLAQQGFITPQGYVRLVDLLNAFTDYYSRELLHLLHSEMKTTGQLDSVWLARLVHIHEANKNKSVHHPLYHILATHFLGSNIKTFIHQVIAPPTLFGDGPWPCLNPVCTNYQQREIHTYQIAEVGVKGKPVAIFACTCGYTYSRKGPDTSPEDAFRKGRALCYGSVWETKLHELWSDPTVTLKEIAHHLGVNRYTANHHATRLNLPVPRRFPRSTQFELLHTKNGKDVLWYRSQWLAIVEEAPEDPTYILRRKSKGIYSWLVRHDKEWLNAHKPLRSKTKNNPATAKKSLSIKEKASSDALMAENVRITAQKLINVEEYPVRITMTRICQEIPSIRNKPSSTNAPLTIQALTAVAETQRTFAVRKIEWLTQQYMKELIRPGRREFIQRANLKKKILRVPLVQQAIEDALATLSQPLKTQS